MSDELMPNVVETRILTILTNRVLEAQAAPYSRDPASERTWVLACALCRWYTAEMDGDAARAPNMALQHLMCSHDAIYERAMLHCQREHGGMARQLHQDEFADDATLELLCSRHPERGQPGSYVYMCSGMDCRYVARGTMAVADDLMHNHLEVCHRNRYAEVRRYTFESSKRSVRDGRILTSEEAASERRDLNAAVAEQKQQAIREAEEAMREIDRERSRSTAGTA